MRFVLILLVSLVIIPLAQAEIFIAPRVALEYQFYSVEQDAANCLDDNYLAPAVGLSIYSSSGMFFDVETFQFDQTGSNSDTLSMQHRYETAFTGGYRLASGVLFFGGYKFAQTELLDDKDETCFFETAGPFAGISNSYSLTDRIKFNLSIALASMKATIEGVRDGYEDNYERDSINYSVGAALNTAIYKDLIGSIGAKYQAYDYQVGDEVIASIFAKIAYRF